MVAKLSTLLAALPLAAAWPGVMEMNAKMQKRAEPAPRAPLFKSGRPNTGRPAAGFNAQEQFVDVREGSGHEFRSPGQGDLRGQCPGLNAASNHGFLPRNGIASTQDTITGLGAAYGMAPDLALFLAIVSEALSGDPIAGKWSIGGAFPTTLNLFNANGILGTHNKYEGDSSIVRGDAYLNGGNVGVFQMRSWEHLYALAEEYTLDDAAAQSDYVTRWSIENNPQYFSAPFSGLVAPAAHDFVIHFMSNHTAEQPGGVLTRDILKQFFSVTGEPGNFVHTRGQERIPENWYRRPNANAYTIPEVVADVFINNAMYPGIVRFGGNTGTVNSFAGVDVTDITGGALNAADLAADPNKASCFLLQASLAGIPDAASPLLGSVGTLLGWATEQLGPLGQQFGCPQLSSFRNDLFNNFPGAKA